MRPRCHEVGIKPKTFEEKVEEVQHEILWGLANMNIERLITQVRRQREYMEGGPRRPRRKRRASSHETASPSGYERRRGLYWGLKSCCFRIADDPAKRCGEPLEAGAGGPRLRAVQHLGS